MFKTLTKCQQFSENVKNSHKTLKILIICSKNTQKNVKCSLMVRKVQEIHRENLKNSYKVLREYVENVLEIFNKFSNNVQEFLQTCGGVLEKCSKFSQRVKNFHKTLRIFTKCSRMLEKRSSLISQQPKSRHHLLVEPHNEITTRSLFQLINSRRYITELSRSFGALYTICTRMYGGNLLSARGCGGGRSAT